MRENSSNTLLALRGSLLLRKTMMPWKKPRPCFYQTRSAWSVGQGSNKNHSPACNFAPTLTKFCVKWEGLSLPHDTKFGNCRCTIVDSRAIPSWSLIHGLRWSGLIKAEPGESIRKRAMEAMADSEILAIYLHSSCWWSPDSLLRNDGNNSSHKGLLYCAF